MGRINGPYVAAAGGVVFAGLVLLLAVQSLPEARREDLVFETASAAIQVFPLAFFGVIVAELVRRRDSRRARDEKQDEFLHGFLKDVVLTYNRTKAIRRSLRGAGLGPTGQGQLTEAQLIRLDEELADLSDAQLDLERLKREARARGDIFRKPEPVTDALHALEQYVNGVVKDWESKRSSVEVGMGIDALTSWTRFWAFEANKDEGGDFGEAARRMELIEDWIWHARSGTSHRGRREHG